MDGDGGVPAPARGSMIRPRRRLMALSLTSPSFQDHGEIPIEYTHDGKDISPPLAWSNVAAGARSLAVVVEDPDAPDPAAPQRTMVH